MNDEQVERLLTELASTRESFDQANAIFSSTIQTIKWSRRNTIIQYFLIVFVILFGAMATLNYVQYRHDACQRDNEIVVIVREGMQNNGIAIGAALAVVFNADSEDLNRYIDAYNQQRATETVPFREC